MPVHLRAIATITHAVRPSPIVKTVPSNIVVRLRLIQQQQVSPRTVAAYRDSFRLLLAFAHRKLHKCPSELTLDDLNAPLILAFLKYLRMNDITASVVATHALRHPFVYGVRCFRRAVRGRPDEVDTGDQDEAL